MRVASTASRAVIPPHTPASTRSSLLRSKSGAVRSACADDVDPPQPDAGVDHIAAARTGPDDGIPPGVLQPQHVHVPELRTRIHLDPGTIGDDDSQLADTDLCFYLQRLRGRPNCGQVDPQASNAEVVGRSNRRYARGRIDVIADTVV